MNRMTRPGPILVMSASLACNGVFPSGGSGSDDPATQSTSTSSNTASVPGSCSHALTTSSVVGGSSHGSSTMSVGSTSLAACAPDASVAEDSGSLLDAGTRRDASVSRDAGGFLDGSTVRDGSLRLDAGIAGDASATSPDGGSHAIWHPQPATSWQWQLSGTLDTSLDVQMYDVDLFDTAEGVIDQLHSAGRIVICYFSAGSREDWRSDADQFPPEAVGRAMDGWAGEKWLDVRNSAVRTIMSNRMDLAASKECDGVEPDNVDGYANATGFPLTAANQLDYNRFLAREAHARGLSVGLKNDLDQVVDLVGDFDWALNEECFQYNECDLLEPFILANKAVFQVEYGNESLATSVCPRANQLDFDTLIKRLSLNAWRVSCR